MGRTIALDIPDGIYESLARKAKQAGCTPEELALELITSANGDVVDDPVEKFIGAFKSNVPDWLDRHDHYIGLGI